MAILVLIAIGFALILGQRDFAKALVKPFVGLILVLSFLPGFLDRMLASVSTASDESAGSGWTWLAVLCFALFAVLGFVLWRRREASARARELARRRDGHPRRRALPPPPFDDPSVGSGGF